MIATRRTASRLTRLLRPGGVVLLVALTVGACSGSGSEDASSGSDSSAARAESAGSPSGGMQEAEAAADRALASDDLNGAVEKVAGSAPSDRASDPAPSASLIRTGTVDLRSANVGQARFDVQKVVDRYGGDVAEENTEADDDGDALRSRLVLRVPVADFDEAVGELRDVASLVSSTTRTDDVTTKVIDTEVRVRLQRRSIERISLLLDRAQSIRDVVSIERELAQREADLGSLEKRQGYLADQTALSTITVSIERPPEKKSDTRPEEKEATGFVPGLRDGWHALTGLSVAGLQVGGAVLPFAVVLLLLGGPLWWARRRFRTAQSAQAARAAQSG